MTNVGIALASAGRPAAPPRKLIGLSPRRWSQRSRAILWLTLAFWISNYLILTLGIAIEGRDGWLSVASVRAGLVMFGLGLCYALHLALEKLAGRSFRKRAIAAAISAPAIAELYAWASYFSFAALDPQRLAQPIDWSQAIFTVGFWTWFFLAWAGLYLALQFSFDIKEEEQRSSELRALAHNAKLQALHNQVNPHFLFNSLNSISALISDKRSDEADQMVVRLGDFFRKTLAVDPAGDTSLSNEIELQQAYLRIEQVRYPDLQVSVDLPSELRGAAVPSLILQPLIENAVKYGVAGSPPPAAISIRGSATGGWLTLEIEDSGVPCANEPASGLGIGLRNVRERLSLRYGDRQSLSVSRGVRNGCRVVITMPLEYL
jgi:signal transduction histidine kinase